MNINGKRVWITGASSGIGKALAENLAAKGAELLLSARRTDKLEALKSSLPCADKHTVMPLDLADENSITEAVAKFGNNTLDALINNAGISQRSQARDTALSVHKEVMQINFFATVALTQQLLSKLLDSQGMLVNIASVAGKVGGQGMSGYAASKHALMGYMDSLRAEERRHGLSVLNVCPGFVQTEISLHARTEHGDEFGAMADSIANGISADQCASEIITAMERERFEIYPGKGLSKWAPTIKRIAPNLLHKLAARQDIR